MLIACNIWNMCYDAERLLETFWAPYPDGGVCLWLSASIAAMVDRGPACRIAACFAVVFVCWDLKAVFYTIWGPLTFLMGYSDPRKPTNDLLHGAPPADPQ